MSLDGLIMRRNYNGRGRGQGQFRGQVQVRGQGQVRGHGWDQGQGRTFVGRGVRMLRQGPLRINHSSSFKIAKSFSRAKDLLRHDLFEDAMAITGLTKADGGTKLYISNLDYGVSNEDIKELFSEVGDLKRYATHYDRNGRSSGSAEVVYTRRSDAIAALKRYNNVQLDGKPMKIELIGNNLGLPIAPRVNVVGGANGRGKRTVVLTPEFGQGVTGFFKQQLPRWNRGSMRGLARGRGRGQDRISRRLPVKKTAQDLDKELETYHAEAMST